MLARRLWALLVALAPTIAGSAALPHSSSPPGSSLRIIPHSHVDPGWLNTYDEYYGSVKSIMRGVSVELLVGPNRTFAWEGAAYFTRWVRTLAPIPHAHRHLRFDGGLCSLHSCS